MQSPSIVRSFGEIGVWRRPKSFASLRVFSEFHAAGSFLRDEEGVKLEDASGVPGGAFAARRSCLRRLIPPGLESVDRHALRNENAGHDLFQTGFGEVGEGVVTEDFPEFLNGGEAGFVWDENVEHFRIRIEEDGGLNRGADGEGEKVARREGVDSEGRGPLVDRGYFAPDFGIGEVSEASGFDLLELLESRGDFGSGNFGVSCADRLQNGLAGDVRRKHEFRRVVERVPEELTFKGVFFGEFHADFRHSLVFGDAVVPGIEERIEIGLCGPELLHVCRFDFVEKLLDFIFLAGKRGDNQFFEFSSHGSSYALLFCSIY
mgnify:CR=1 FL=1